MSCTSKLQQKYLQRDKRNEWPDDWQNQFIKLKKVWSNKIKTTENIRMPRPIYINTFDNQILSECEYVKSDSSCSSAEDEYHYRPKEKINKERENKSNKKILDEIPCFIQILRQLHDKISNILEMSDEELCRNLQPKQKRKRRPKRKYKLREKHYRTETCSVKSTSPERDYETESLISSDEYTNYRSIKHDRDEMKLSIVHNMSNSNSQFVERKNDEKYSIKINYVNRLQLPEKTLSNTVDDVHQVSSNCLLIPLITNVKRPDFRN